MNVYTLPGANALKVAQEVRQLMAQMSQKFPPGLKYTVLLDTSTFIKDSIHGVYEALIEAGILVLIVIMLFLQNFRAMLVPATTVPVTIIGAFAAMALLGFTVNLMTLFALILAIGIVVDDAIVIVENASHYIEQGLTPKDAAIKAMSELTGPVLGITLVLTSVFLPASFLPGITGQMFRQFALVIAATAIISAHQRADAEADAVRAVSAAGAQGSAKSTGSTGVSIGSTARWRSATSESSAGWRSVRGRWSCLFFCVVGVAGCDFCAPSHRVSSHRRSGLLRRGRATSRRARRSRGCARWRPISTRVLKRRPRPQRMGNQRRILRS